MPPGRWDTAGGGAAQGTREKSPLRDLVEGLWMEEWRDGRWQGRKVVNGCVDGWKPENI